MATRKFRVTVNGKTFEVEVEELGEGEHRINRVQSSNFTEGAGTPAPSAATVSDGAVAAPIPGKVLRIKVKVSDRVKKGDELMVVESMKIENPVMAPMDGMVTRIHVSVGDHVKTGDKLVTIG